jgi:hypothetical protein
MERGAGRSWSFELLLDTRSDARQERRQTEPQERCFLLTVMQASVVGIRWLAVKCQTIREWMIVGLTVNAIVGLDTCTVRLVRARVLWTDGQTAGIFRATRAMLGVLG